MSLADARVEPAHSRSIDLRIVVAIWLSLFVYGVIAAPMPAVNEPHYLCKAKHFWQPEWCAKDFFLESQNAHTVFYATLGWLTQWLSLEQTASIGRAVSTLVLAIGLVSLTKQLLSGRWSPLAAVWLFLAFASCGSLSGEWLVGGVEGKVICYGLLFASLGQVIRGWLILAGGLAGVAISFHPVVGAWGVLAFVATRLGMGVMRIAKCEASEPSIAPLQSANSKPRSVSIALIVMAILSLPGLIPVVRLLLEPAPAATKYAATYIQVYYRLAHHLDPMRFPLRAYGGYGALLMLWLILSRGQSKTSAKRVFHDVIGWSVLFAFAGLIVGWGPRPANLMPFFAERMNLLKFYPFRLADVLVPLAVSIEVLGWLESRAFASHRAAMPHRAMIREAGPEDACPSLGKRTVVLFAFLFVLALGRAHSVVETNRFSGELRSDWVDACRWIDTHLPADALVQAPHNGWAFKWFAERAEYVAFKDCPQDAAGIVEWNRRLTFLKKWYEDQYADQFYSASELGDFRRETGISHLLTDRLGPLELEPVYRNETFQVYDLSSLD